MAAVLTPVATGGCRAEGNTTRYDIRGQIQEVRPEADEVVLKHDTIPDYMDAMTMPFRVEDPAELEGREPGDLVTAVLVVSAEDAALVDLRRIGHAPVVAGEPRPAASSGFELLRPGDDVPDATFIDQDGRELRLVDLRGRAVALTFIYTRCPIPTFCPTMDRHFATIQRAVAEDADLDGKVRLLSVSFDPTNDIPPVLKAHAEALGADPGTWSFLTGDRDDLDRFAARFGVQVTRDLDDPSTLSHNLRTAVIAPGGTLAAVHIGFDWTPTQVLDELRSAAGRP